MLVKFYTISEDSNVINKNLGVSEDVEVNLKKDFEINFPELFLAQINEIDFKKFNYCTIPEINRNYFIDSIEIISYKIVKLILSIDYLETYKSGILESKARYFRNIKTGDYSNVELDKSFLKTITIHNSDKGFSGENSLIMSVVGG